MSIPNINGDITTDSKALLAENVPIMFSLQHPELAIGEIFSATCSISSVSFTFGLSDLATDAFSCGGIESGSIFLPTDPFSQFKGVEAAGGWKMHVDILREDSSYLNKFTIDYCITPNSSGSDFSSNIARSNWNIPGYRYDGGVAYYSSVIRSNQGEELYTTISRTI